MTFQKIQTSTFLADFPTLKSVQEISFFLVEKDSEKFPN